MSRGPGRMMLAVCDALRAASGPLTFVQLGNAVYGSRVVERYRNGRRRKVTLPAGDSSNLHRALHGLIRRGIVVVVGGQPFSESARRHGMRYVVSDCSTGNEERPANDMTPLSPLPALPIARTLPANDVALDGTDATCVALAGVPRNNTGPAPDQGSNDVVNPTKRRMHSRSSESSSSSVRPTPADSIAASIRGELPLPARVFAWERGLLSILVGDFFQELRHAAHTSNEPDP